MWCDSCEQDPCACQRKLAPYGQGDWIVGYCEIPGCGVRIRYRLGNPGNPQCKWHQAGEAYNSHENKQPKPNTGHAA